MKEVIIEYLKAFTHNVFIHPLLMFLPEKVGDKLHDWNATWAFSLNRYDKVNTESNR